MAQQRREGRGRGAYAGLPAGARRTEARARGDWREAGGGAAAADDDDEPGTAPPSLDAAEGEPPMRGRSDPWDRA